MGRLRRPLARAACMRRGKPLAALDARDRLVEVADDRAHRVEHGVLQAQQLVALRLRSLDPPARLGADTNRRLLGLRDDLAGAGVGAVLDLGCDEARGPSSARARAPSRKFAISLRALCELALEVAVRSRSDRRSLSSWRSVRRIPRARTRRPRGGSRRRTACSGAEGAGIRQECSSCYSLVVRPARFRHRRRLAQPLPSRRARRQRLARYHSSAATTVAAAAAIWIPISSAGRPCSTAKATSCAARMPTRTSEKRVRASERKW